MRGACVSARGRARASLDVAGTGRDGGAVVIKESYEDLSEPGGLTSVLVSRRALDAAGRIEPLPVLVTGICGRLGRRLVRTLHRERRVIGIDRRPFTGKPKDVEHYAIDIRKKKTEYVSDLSDGLLDASLAKEIETEERALLSRGTPSVDVVREYKTPGGERKWFSESKAPVLDPEGAGAGFV